MAGYAKYGNYDKFPKITVRGFDGSVFSGYDKICAELRAAVKGKKKAVIVVDFYTGVYGDRIIDGLKGLGAAKLIDAESCAYDGAEIERRLYEDYLGGDRVFGF
ncbi:MAG: hypothetical protein LBS99_04875, partial [Clostridiales bacterium]|nr:hypothetical protein [Clostridiales bacterium]